MKKLLSVLLVLVMALGMSMAYAENTEISGKIVFAQHRTDLEDQMNAMIAAFNEIYPNVEVEMETVADYQNTMAIRVAGGDKLPDVLEFWCDQMCPKNEATKYVKALNDSKWYGVSSGDGVYVTDAGEVYAVPGITVQICFMYNKELWAQAGIESVPTTWDEFKEDLEALKALEGVIPLTTQYKTNWPLTYWYHSMPSCLNGSNIYIDGASNDNMWGNEHLVASLDAFKDLIDSGLTDPDLMSSDWDLQATDFVAGKIGTYLTGSYAYGTMTSLGMESDKIGYFAMPSVYNDGKTYVAVTVDTPFAISKDTQYPEAAEAFFDFIVENYCVYTNSPSGLKGGVCPIDAINGIYENGDVIVVCTDADTPGYGDVNAIAGQNGPDLVQEYVIAEDTEAVIEAWNARWNEAREQAGF